MLSSYPPTHWPQGSVRERDSLSRARTYFIPMTTHTSELRAHVLELLHGGHAHVSFEDAVADLPASLRGMRPDSLPYSPWELVEHIRITQRDILDYSIARKKADYEEIPWPKGYWPQTPAPPSAKAWDDAVAAVRADREAM